jgi:hypothetical protein
MTNFNVELSKRVDEAYESLVGAAEGIGKIQSRNDSARYIVLKARYGLNPVTMRSAVMSNASGDGSVIEFSGRGQDVWGVASRKIIDRLIEAL